MVGIKSQDFFNLDHFKLVSCESKNSMEMQYYIAGTLFK